ncbi:MAG: hypothetical protein JSW27_16370 [Phycisphaerales bacterium]|nr:MAG: hypothetical protein JSW27_16370 [Phycisphaerales bacterium]
MMHLNGSRAMVARLLFLIVSLLPAGGRAVAYEVGQRWVYQHQGPRFGSTEPNAIDGQRILLVIGGPDQGHPHWLLEERYTADEAVVGRLHVTQEQQLTGFDIENDKGEVATLTYDTPMAYPIPQLEVGQEQTIVNVLRTESPKFVMPVEIVIRRLADETIITPAGEFADCVHYRTTTHSTFDVKVASVPVSEQRDRWYHKSVSGVVKEVYRKDPVKFLAWTQEGYTATSVLAAFDIQDIEPVTRGDANGSSVTSAAKGPSPAAPSTTPAPGFPVWMPAAVAVVFGAAILILLKRPRRN